LSTPVRVSLRFSKSWVTPPRTRMNEPRVTWIHASSTKTLMMPCLRPRATSRLIVKCCCFLALLIGGDLFLFVYTRAAYQFSRRKPWSTLLLSISCPVTSPVSELSEGTVPWPALVPPPGASNVVRLPRRLRRKP